MISDKRHFVAIFLTTLYSCAQLSQAQSLQVTGDLGISVNQLLDGSGNITGYGLAGITVANLNFNVTSYTVQIGIVSGDLKGQSYSWGDPTIWNAPTLDFANLTQVTTTVLNVTDGSFSVQDINGTIATLQNLGPTENTVSVNVPFLSDLTSGTISASAGLTLKYAVELDSGANITMGQPDVTLQSLTVDSGAILTSNSSLDVRTDFINSGRVLNFGGTVEGNFVNDGLEEDGNGVVVNSGFNVHGLFINTGALTVGEGGALDWISASVNAGTINLEAGKIDITNGLTNTGTFAWTGGILASGLTNDGTMTVSGTETKTIDTTGALTNHGTITQTGTAQVVQQGVLTNAADGTYNFTGDGGLLQITNTGTVNNAGLFEKTGGTGTSTVAPFTTFNNTGTVEVNSGVLSFQGGGTLSGGSYVFSNGGVAQIYSTGSGVTISGANTLSGNGTLEMSLGSIFANASSATFTNLTDGANILIDGAHVNGSAGSTITFDLSGNSQVTLASGGIGGYGAIINNGNFTWTGGTLANFASGGSTGGTLLNHGVITQTGTANVVNQGTLTNATDGIYKFTGDGTIASSDGGMVNNAGLFGKTGGTGTSTVAQFVSFNNTGTVEVNSGVLSFQGGGTLSGGSYVFSNGGVAQIYSTGSGVTISGANTLSGNGTLEMSLGSIFANASSATFTNLTDGANILIDGAHVNGSAGSTITFDLSGNSQVTLASGGIGGYGAIINNGNFTWTGGTLANFASGGSTGGTLLNHGVITQTGTAQVVNQGVITNAADGVYKFTGDGTITSTNGGTINNAGLFEKTAGTGTSTIGVSFNNSGTVEVNSGTLAVQGNVAQQSGSTLTGGTWKINANSTLSFTSGGNITTNQGSVTLSGANSNFTNFNYINNNQGSFNLSNGRSFTTLGSLANSGQVNIDKSSSLIVSGTFTQTASGSLAGEGALVGNANLSGNIEAGKNGMTIDGNLTLNSDATLKFDLGSINIQGNLTLDNVNLVLNLALANSPVAYGTQLTLLTYTGAETGLLDYNGIALKDGSLFADGVNTFQISYAVGDPSIVLTSETDVVPEPSTYALLGIGLALLALFVRSKDSLVRHRCQPM